MSTNKSSRIEVHDASPDSRRSIIKSTSIMALGTLASRILGFLRDVILAKLLGTGFRADAFFVASRIPNLFRDLVGEGAVNTAIVPVLSEYKEKEDKKALWNFASVILTLALIILSFLTILGIIFAPVIVKMIAPGFIVEEEKLLLTVQLTRIMFPYLVFIGITAYAMGILYTYRSFTVPAFSPCLLNIALIVSAYIASWTAQDPVLFLAFGTLVGGFLQLFVHFQPILKTGMRFTIPKNLKHPGVIKIGKLLVPRILGSGVYQASVFIDTFCASLSGIVGPGGISAIYYANRIIQFPMGVFSVALASAVLPTLAGLSAKKDMESVKRVIVFSLENIFFIMCPTIVVLLLLSTPIVQVLFQRGEFDHYSTTITSSALAFYSIGLFSFGGIKILVTAFNALQDTKTPAQVALACLFINAALDFILMGPLKVGGIALASAIAGTIDFLILFYIMDKKLGGLNSGLLQYFCKVTFASVLIGIIEYFSWNFFSFSSQTVKLLVIGIGGFILYEIFCLILKVEQAHKIAQWFKNGMVF